MISYRADDMDGMLARLKDKDVDILKGPESHENGQFVWLLDPEGNKMELWVDSGHSEALKMPDSRFWGLGCVR